MHFRRYVNLVSGLTRATRARASATAHALLAQAGLEEAANEASERVSKLAEEILHASRANREMFEKLVTAEVDRAVAQAGLRPGRRRRGASQGGRRPALGAAVGDEPAKQPAGEEGRAGEEGTPAKEAPGQDDSGEGTP